MNSTLPIITFIAFTAFVAPVPGQDAQFLGSHAPSQQDQDDTAPLTEPRHITLNMTQAEVLTAMHGKPDDKLSPSIWIYYGFHTQLDPALRRFDTLVVFFSPERVYKYRLVERKTLRELLADIRKTPTPRQPEMISEWPAPPRLDEVVTSNPPRRIGLGMTPEDVARAMRGNPNVYLAPDIWVYWDFQVLGSPLPKDPDTLVVFFSQGRVIYYKLVSRQAVVPWLDERTA